MELNIAFGDKEMTTSVYIKLDAADQLLLSEGVCRLLDIVSYHSAVEIWRGGRATKKKATVSVDQGEDVGCDDGAAHVPTVSGVRSIRVLPHHRVAVPVEVTGIDDSTGTWVVEPEELDSFQVEESLLSLCNEENPAVNSTGFTQTLPHGTRVGTIVECSEVKPTTQGDHTAPENLVRVNAVMSHGQITWRQQKLQHLLKDYKSPVSNPQRDELHVLLLQYHDVFSLSEDDRGETDIVQMTIDTGDAPPQHQCVQHIPVAARQEVVKLLNSMQKSVVI